MIDNVKSLFDIPSDICFLNCAAQSPMLKSTRIAGDAGLAIKANPWTLNPDFWDARSNELREILARMISVQANDVALIPSTAYGVATAAKNLSLDKGQDIVLLEGQFLSNVIAWEQKALACGGELNVVKRPVDYDWTPHVLEAISEKTAIVALPPCHWTDGSKIDLVTVGKRCRDKGAALVVDATQAVGAMTIDIRAIQPDFLICSSYKWLLSPVGSAFLYAAPKWQEGEAIEHCKFNCDDVDPSSGMHLPKVGALRFDMGGRNNFILLSMALEAAKQVSKWGPDEIQKTLRPMTDLVAEMAVKRGWKVPVGENRIGHIIGISFPNQKIDNLAKKLAAESVFVSERGAGIRVSPYLYNNADDIKQLFGALDRFVGV
ncbi:aminotransferase class V-fold PLP-dependent enzyme [Kiloniella sp. EL199]|uniref:aminotransferase class V-fold PLP-dependent enzyme n=1 Tax=Kiloniella sp. EL199 TaxID=2107581 RepID=UPI000EA2A9A0|nr:aminotransferase class V-fold PLP-dependent enzyme [Kiloniella sp. EL199]